MNKKRFLINGALLTAVGIAMRTVSLFFNAYVTRAVGAEGVGLYTLVMTVYNFGVTFATAGISLTVTRLVAKAKGEGRSSDVTRILLGAVLYALIFSALASCVLFFGGNILAEHVLSDARAGISLRILAPSLIPLAMISVFSGYFIGVRKVGFNAATQILGQVFKICATVWLLSRSIGLGPEQAARTLAIGTTATEILCFVFIFAEFLLERRGKGGAMPPAISEVGAVAAPLAVSAYVRQALLTVEHVLIPSCLRKKGLGVSRALSAYGILHGMALPMVIYPMATLSSFAGLLVPELAEAKAEGDRAAMERITSRSLSVTVSYAVVTAVMLLVFSEPLGYVVYSSSDAGYYVAVLSLAVPIMYLDHVTDSVLKGIGEQVYSMWVNVTDSLLSIFLVLFLIPRMGIMGYALIIIIMEGYNFILSFGRLRRKIRIRVNFCRCALLPFVSSLLASVLTKFLFISQGSSATLGVMICTAVFSLCATVLFYKTFDLLFRCIQKGKARIL